MDLKEAPTKFLGSEDERAVSPVIGVVLMVAVTVILAAVIAAFVMGMGDDLGDGGSVNAVVDTDVNETDVTVEVTDMGNADYVTLADSDGEPVDESITLDATGASTTWEGVDNNSSYNVHAFTGDASDLEEGETIESSVESTSVISDVEVGNP